MTRAPSESLEMLFKTSSSSISSIVSLMTSSLVTSQSPPLCTLCPANLWTTLLPSSLSSPGGSTKSALPHTVRRKVGKLGQWVEGKEKEEVDMVLMFELAETSLLTSIKILVLLLLLLELVSSTIVSEILIFLFLLTEVSIFFTLIFFSLDIFPFFLTCGKSPERDFLFRPTCSVDVDKSCNLIVSGVIPIPRSSRLKVSLISGTGTNTVDSTLFPTFLVPGFILNVGLKQVYSSVETSSLVELDLRSLFFLLLLRLDFGISADSSSSSFLTSIATGYIILASAPPASLGSSATFSASEFS